MRTKLIASCAAFIICCSVSARAQQQQSAGGTAAAPSSQGASATEQRAPLAERSMALDALGRPALAGSLVTTTLNGSDDAPLRNVRLVIENRSTAFYTYVSGWATFYNAAGVRCGEGMFKLDALAPQESAETDTPGLRLTCAPVSWRIVALNLLTRAGDTARPILPQQDQSTGDAATQPSGATAQTDVNTQTGAANNSQPIFVNLSIGGHTYRVPLGSTLEIPVNNKRTRITVTAAPQ